jgi:ABC-type glutathione transport system ATPase component
MTSESARRAASSVAAPDTAGRAAGRPDLAARAAVISFDRVSKLYRGGRLALDDVMLSLPAGGSLGLVGESGSGKTTCVRLALGLERPTSGQLAFNGAGYPSGRAGLRSLRRQVGFVLQDPYDSLDPRMTIGDIVTEPLRIHRLPGGRGARGETLAAEQLAAVGLPGADLRSYPARYSGGGRQRIAIARALISSPSVLICDEPTSSLDVSVQSQIVNLLLDARRERDLSMLFVTHDLDLIGRVVETVAVMYAGRVVETGPAELIRHSPRHPYTRALHDAVPANHPRDRRLAARGAGPLCPGEPGPGPAAEPGADLTDAAAGPGAGQAAAGTSLVRPDSCVFASRCPRVQARCRQERPPTVTEEALRSYACFYPVSDI